jgi:hypothetical protein
MLLYPLLRAGFNLEFPDGPATIKDLDRLCSRYLAPDCPPDERVIPPYVVSRSTSLTSELRLILEPPLTTPSIAIADPRVRQLRHRPAMVGQLQLLIENLTDQAC